MIKTVPDGHILYRADLKLTYNTFLPFPENSLSLIFEPERQKWAPRVGFHVNVRKFEQRGVDIPAQLSSAFPPLLLHKPDL